MANTLLNAVKDLRNDSLRDLVSASAFTGEEEAATPSFQGSNYGYISGGGPAGPIENVVERFSFTSDGGGTDVGNLFEGRYNCSGQSSSTHGYTCAGQPGAKNTIDKFPFTSGFTTATDVGNLTAARILAAGQSSILNGYGYNTGGGGGAPPGGNVIEKFSFSTDANATDVGDLISNRNYASGNSSTTHGYTSGNIPIANIIDKFPFSTDGNSTNVGDLTVVRGSSFGQSSTTHGYTSGGYGGQPAPGYAGEVNVVDKFPFSTDANATDVGDLTVARQVGAGQSSTTHGYSAGGYGGADAHVGGTGISNVIDKFPFTSDDNATDVGDLTQARTVHAAGQQY